ncbi:MAG: Gfo/Idh/MocA family oxidoreductase [Verrucomicrobia bacterium]|nr:Gfo/Idh/MocA family oxidoreductase [Verrucomicrobiota bacterium]
MKQFRVGIVGYGWAAGAHIAAINAGALGQVTKVCSSRVLDAKELSARHGCSIKTYTDYQTMLAEPDLHAVSICSFHRHHKDQIIAAARAGKHIIAEKPLALRLGDLREVEKAVRDAGVKLCVCLEMRFSAQFRAVKSLIDRGLLGKLHYGEVDYYHGIGPWYPGFKWYRTAEDGVSSLLLAGCHAMDILLFCLGGDVDEVFAYSTASANPVFAPYEYPPTTVTMLRFKNGAVGKVASVLDCFQPYYFHTHLVGSEGALLDDKFHSNLIDGLNRNQWSKLSYRPVDSSDVHDHPYQAEFDRFFEAIANNEDMPLTGLADAVRTHEVIFAADLSWQQKRQVKMEEIKLKGAR